MKDHSLVLEPLQTSTAAIPTEQKPTAPTTPLPIIPTGIEAILSPKSNSGRNLLAIDDLYDERRSLRREWIRFMDSMDSCEEGKNNDRYESATTTTTMMGDVELCYPTATNTNTCHLTSLLSDGSDYDDDEDEDYSMEEDRNDYNERNNDKDVFKTFRSLKEQVDHLDGILEEFSDLPKSPARKTVPPTFRSKSIAFSTKKDNTKNDGNQPKDSIQSPKNPLRRGLYDECDTFEDEWEALNKLEIELRQELKSVSIEIDTMDYSDEKDDSQPDSDETDDSQPEKSLEKNQQAAQHPSNAPSDEIDSESDNKARVSTRDRKQHNPSKTKTSPIPAIVEVSQPAKEPSTSTMFMNCVLNTELSCTPQACSGVLDQDRDDWDAIAAHRVEYDPSILLTTESLLPDREKVLTPISETSSDENELSSPMFSSQSSFSKEDTTKTSSSETKQSASSPPKPVSYTIMVPAFASPNTNQKETKDSDSSKTAETKSTGTEPSYFSSQESDHKGAVSPTETKQSTAAASRISDAPVPAPQSYTIMVPAFSKSESKIEGHESNASTTTTSSGNDEEGADIIENNSSSREEENYLDSNILVVPSNSASTLTREEGPSIGSITSHDKKLNEILLEDENETQRSKSQGSEQKVLRDILAEDEDEDDRSSLHQDFAQTTCEKVEIPSPPGSPSSIRDTMTPANHERSVRINNFETVHSVHPDVERQTPHTETTKTPVANKTESSFMSEYLSFELDAISDASLDLMTVSGEDAILKAEKTEIVPNEQFTAALGMNELAILNSESGDSDVSPLTSPLSVEDQNEGFAGMNRDLPVNHLVGRIYAKVGGVLVLDEDRQDPMANKDPILLERTPKNERDNLMDEDNGIETILAGEPPKCCSFESDTNSPSNVIKVLSQEDDIEVIQFSDSEEKLDEKAEEDFEVVRPDDSNKKSDEIMDEPHSQSPQSEIPGEDIDHREEDCLDINLLSINEMLIDSIVSRNFSIFSDLTMEDISGIDWQGEVISGRYAHWKAQLLLRFSSEECDHEDPSPSPYEVSIEQSSIKQISPDVAMVICTLVESKNDVPVNIFRETRIWKKKNSEEGWKNCHMHRSKIHTPSETEI